MLEVNEGNFAFIVKTEENFDRKCLKKVILCVVF